MLLSDTFRIHETTHHLMIIKWYLKGGFHDFAHVQAMT